MKGFFLIIGLTCLTAHLTKPTDEKVMKAAREDAMVQLAGGLPDSSYGAMAIAVELQRALKVNDMIFFKMASLTRGNSTSVIGIGAFRTYFGMKKNSKEANSAKD
jgi:hypothetical protein